MGYFSSLENIRDEKENIVAPKFSTVEYSHESFLDKLDTFSNTKIKEEIKLGDYFDYDHFDDPKTRVIFQQLWTNKIFLTNILELLDSDKEYRNKIISVYITSVNKIVFDYMTLEVNNPEILNLLLEISKCIDYQYIIKLCTIMPLDIARMITITRFSSFNQREAITRFNDVICKCGLDFTEKDIIYIYKTFFQEHFMELFNITMTTVETSFSERIHRKVYDMISLAMIDILESMTSEDIYKTLHYYGNFMSLVDSCNCRFSLHSLSDDYKRINVIIDELMSKGINIP